jgi:flavin reductase (DIM6/NTAB) family NADH-FMN oxidoreductase RutF
VFGMKTTGLKRMIEMKISVHKRKETTMGKQHWKPGNMLNPVPAVMVSVTDKEGKSNIITVAWAGTVCTNPPMVSISVRPSRYSYQILEETGEFVINLTNESLVKACDYCGVVSGRDVDKFAKTGLTPIPMEHVHAMGIDESPVNMECKITEKRELGSHTMFIAEVVGVTVDDQYMDETGKFHINESGLVMYSHGEYFALGKKLGKWSVEEMLINSQKPD